VSQFLFRVDRGVVGRRLQPEEADGARARPVEQSNRQREDFVEGVQRPCDGEGHTLGALKRHRLRGQFAEDDVKESDNREGDGERDCVQRDLGDASLERLFQQMRDDRLAYPTERERSYRDAELRGGDVCVEVVEEPQQAARGAVA
jgi:hypothetical protein